MRRIWDALAGLLAALTGALLAVVGFKRVFGHTDASEDARKPEPLAAPDEGNIAGPEPVAAASSQTQTPPKHPRAGWSTPQPEHIPAPTYWPVVMSLGIVLLLWGIITSLLISVVGLALFGLSLAGWIGELLREGEEH